MRIFNFEWDDWNTEHISHHLVTPQEAEEACYNQSLSRKAKDGLYFVYGQTDAGRYLFMVCRYKESGLAYIITARPMTKREKQYYLRER